MKRKLLLLALLAQFCSLTMMAYDAEIDGIYYNFSGTQATVVPGDNLYSGSVVIPASINYNGKTYVVKEIGENAFYFCSGLTSITIPEGVTRIGRASFYGCNCLTSVTIPESVTYIDSESFCCCEKLESIVVADGNPVYDSRDNCNAIIKTASNTLIYGCLATVIPVSVAIINGKAFTGCHGLISVTIPEGVTTICQGAFSDCRNLTSVQISGSVTTIEANAISGSGKLETIFVADGNSVYDSRDNCNAIIETASNTLLKGCKNTIIPASVLSIGQSAFNGCYEMTSIVIPNGVISICESAFCNCSNLMSISIPNTVTKIDGSAFTGENKLESIVVEEGNTVYDSRDNCNAIVETASNTLLKGCKNTVIPSSVKNILGGAFFCCRNLTSITIPEGVTTIGQNAFFGCSELESIIIPESVISIGQGAFAYTKWFKDQQEGVVYINTIAYAYNGTMPENASIVIKDGTTQLASGLFSNCVNLSSITIPEGVTMIGDGAFSNCTNLPFITLPKSVTTIGADAFYYCQNLTSIIIPENVTHIGEVAFGDCYSLSTIKIPGSLTSIGRNTFLRCSALKYVINDAKLPIDIRWDYPFSESNYRNATLYVPRGSKEAYQTADVWKEFKEIIECDYVDVTEQAIAVGGSTTMEINVNNFDTDLVAFQMDLTLPEGVNIDKTGCSLSSRITDEEQELTIGKLENGAYRLTSSSLSLTPISGNEGTLLLLKLTAEEGSVGGKATISNIRFSTSESKRVIMDDKTFDISVMYKVIYKVDGEEYKTVNVLYNTPITPETELTKEGYTFSGWSEIPETMPAHDVEVTGSFTINKYKLIYIVDDMEYKSYEIDYATVITPEAEPTQGGHNFSGWSEIPETMPAHDVEVFGTFSHTLTYLVDGESYKTSSVAYGSNLTLEAEPTKDGYTFGGWSELPETMPAHDVEVTGRFYLFGDVNTDEEVDVVDVVDVARFVVATPSEKFREKLADLNFDNTVNLGDAVVLVNHIAGDQNFVREMFASERSTNTGVLSLTRNGKTLALNLTNGQAYTAFQFDLYVAEDADITLMMLNGQRKQKHQLLYNKVEDGHYRVAALSTSNNEFNGNEGELLNITMNGVSGDEVSVRNIHFFDVKGNDYLFDDIEGSIVTSIENIEHSTLNIEQPIYNAAGLRLNKMQKGINIVGDKKVVVK